MLERDLFLYFWDLCNLNSVLTRYFLLFLWINEYENLPFDTIGFVGMFQRIFIKAIVFRCRSLFILFSDEFSPSLCCTVCSDVVVSSLHWANNELETF